MLTFCVANYIVFFILILLTFFHDNCANNFTDLFIKHFVKSVLIQSYSVPYFAAFGRNTERYGVYLRIQFECEKIRTRITPNTDTFNAEKMVLILLKNSAFFPVKIFLLFNGFVKDTLKIFDDFKNKQKSVWSENAL